MVINPINGAVHSAQEPKGLNPFTSVSATNTQMLLCLMPDEFTCQWGTP